ncbi:hypothetical protein NKR23_g6276 [Pleurostoma richardsiae]|uniref:BZIP domain-containing protein n=1 Tax=Pleurostoma richardsiae TaxID=41990 RepID=A0AA38RWL1_9PEZI|nr:hypothetical protein NKR23_g6276 [Pleurostoma richardsiae]
MQGPNSTAEDAELASQQRRERGRLAQRAFRQRQIETIRALREENQALRDAIDTVSQAAARGDDGALRAAIQSARRIARLGHPDSDDDDGNEDSEEMQPSPCEEGPGSRPAEQSYPASDLYFPSQVSPQMFSSAISPALAPPEVHPPRAPSGRVSPRLTYGVWFEPTGAGPGEPVGAADVGSASEGEE